MLLAELGAGFLLTGLALVIFSAGLAFLSGWRQDALLAQVARRAYYTTALALLGASVALLSALLSHDFAFAYVTEHTDRSLSWPLLAAAFYGGQEGSLLYWALLVTAIGAAAVASGPALGSRVSAYANGILAAITGFFLVTLVFVSSPFDLLAFTPANGLGLNPVLRDGGMLIHPPFLLAGYSSFAVPFAFALGALMAGRRDSAWMSHTRRFALVSWALQTVGLTLGMWWAYHVLGWGGYWGWDPVESVALMPWLATTAYLHTALVQERRQALFRVWGYALVIGAFLLSVFGTFIVRSGVLPSVHTFAVSPLGPWFLAFFVASLLVSGAVLALRGGGAEDPAPPVAAASREGAFVLQNGILVVLIAAVLWGVMLPLLTGLSGRQLVVGPSYYQRVTGPLLVALLALLAVGPLLPWRRAGLTWARSLRWPAAAGAITLAGLLLAGARDAGSLMALPLVAAGLATSVLEFVRGGRFARRLAGPWPRAAARLAVRNRRRYGAYLAHIGILLVAAGIVGSQFWQQERDVVLRPGQSVTVGAHTLTYQGLRSVRQGDHQALQARLTMGGDTLTPARLVYPGMGGQAVSRVAIQSSVLEDVYVVVAGPPSGRQLAFHVFVNPMVTWIWAGAGLLVLGVLLGNLGRPLLEPELAGRPVPARAA
ncbi:MAG: heme lyase CcmF/NrfE family subunit [Candidatus Dormibacteraeota bacterium]|nr:heme lyase CcmF/NrfE family subunit [Candidatus Dormibacteraeota bacterium]